MTWSGWLPPRRLQAVRSASVHPVSCVDDTQRTGATALPPHRSAGAVRPRSCAGAAAISVRTASVSTRRPPPTGARRRRVPLQLRQRVGVNRRCQGAAGADLYPECQGAVPYGHCIISSAMLTLWRRKQTRLMKDDTSCSLSEQSQPSLLMPLAPRAIGHCGRETPKRHGTAGSCRDLGGRCSELAGDSAVCCRVPRVTLAAVGIVWFHR